VALYVWNGEPTLLLRIFLPCGAEARDHYLTTEHSQHKKIHASRGIPTHNINRQAAADDAATGTGT